MTASHGTHSRKTADPGVRKTWMDRFMESETSRGISHRLPDVAAEESGDPECAGTSDVIG